MSTSFNIQSTQIPDEPFFFHLSVSFPLCGESVEGVARSGFPAQAPPAVDLGGQVIC
jgi:hypothetical protein